MLKGITSVSTRPPAEKVQALDLGIGRGWWKVPVYEGHWANEANNPVKLLGRCLTVLGVPIMAIGIRDEFQIRKKQKPVLLMARGDMPWVKHPICYLLGEG